MWLFPAHAGVIPLGDLYPVESHPFPRTRGGDPEVLSWHITIRILFPAHAGVILKRAGVSAD